MKYTDKLIKNWKVKMLDFSHHLLNIVNISREDRALLRSSLIARLLPEDGREYMLVHVLLSSCSSFGCKAINLLSWCKAPTKVNNIKHIQPVRHMSVYFFLYPIPYTLYSAISTCHIITYVLFTQIEIGFVFHLIPNRTRFGRYKVP